MLIALTIRYVRQSRKQIVEWQRIASQRLAVGLVTRKVAGWSVCLRQQLAGEILDFHDSGNEEQIDDGSDEKQASSAEPDQAGNPASQVEAVKSENATAAKKPEKIGNKNIFHSNRLGEVALKFQLAVALEGGPGTVGCRPLAWE